MYSFITKVYLMIDFIYEKYFHGLINYSLEGLAKKQGLFLMISMIDDEKDTFS